MNVEDSYEGAVRRLQRLQHAGIVIEPAAALGRRDDEHDALLARVHDLEELASLACDDNERLERELSEARDQVRSLQRLVATLEESAEDAPAPTVRAETVWPPSGGARPIWPPTVAAQTQSDADLDADLSLAPSKRKQLPILVGLAIAGGVAAVLFTLRPWERPQNVVALAALAPPAAAPAAPVVVVAPAVPAPVAPPIVAAPPAPVRTVAAVVIPTAKPQPPAAPASRKHAAAAKRRAAHKHSQHADSKRHGGKALTGLRDPSSATDPLGGLNL